jgi:hypothetical protein
VRDLGETVRLEVDAASVAAVRRVGGVRAAVAAAEFDADTLEIASFRSGSLNAALPAQLRFR